MASTPGQTSGAMLTLLPESQLAFAQLPLPSSPAPCRPPGGLQLLMNQLRSPWCWVCCCCPASHWSSINVCFMNELALGTLGDVFSLFLRGNSFPTALPLPEGKILRSRERKTWQNVRQKHPSWVCLNDQDGGEKSNLLYARHYAASQASCSSVFLMLSSGQHKIFFCYFIDEKTDVS